MPAIYNIYGGKKVLFTEEPNLNITYKEIMKTIINHATEEGCHQIFCEGGITLCPSKIFGEKIDSEQEEINCSIKSIGCTNCWALAIRKVKE